MSCDFSPFGQVYGNEAIVSAPALPAAYHFALMQLHYYGELSDCRDWNTMQKELSMTMIVEEPLSEPMISLCIPCGPAELEQYRQEMLDGILDFEVEKGNWHYTYHGRIVNWGSGGADSVIRRLDGSIFRVPGLDQYAFVIDELLRNPSSRRAVIDIRDNMGDMGSKEPACLQHIHFFIRNRKLDMKVLFRSNDAVKATFMNAFALIMLQKKVCDELQSRGLDISMGSYTHRANSFHAYERDWNLLEGYCERIRDYYDGFGDAAAVDFSGDWEEQMAEARPEILKKVEELKAR